MGGVSPTGPGASRLAVGGLSGGWVYVGRGRLLA